VSSSSLEGLFIVNDHALALFLTLFVFDFDFFDFDVIVIETSETLEFLRIYPQRGQLSITWPLRPLRPGEVGSDFLGLFF